MSCTSMCSCSENCENEDRGNFALDNNLEDDELFDDFANWAISGFCEKRDSTLLQRVML